MWPALARYAEHMRGVNADGKDREGISMFIRHPSNPLITPAQVKPSRPDFEVIGTFNAGITRFGSETLMLVRVAERPVSSEQGVFLCPHLDTDGGLTVKRIRRADPRSPERAREPALAAAGFERHRHIHAGLCRRAI